MTDRNTAATAHGSVEYETVTCDSCGNEVVKDDAYRFAIGGYERNFIGTHEFDADAATVGWACEFCRDDPAGYPTQPTLIEWRTLDADEQAGFILLAIALITAVIWGVVLL